MAIACLTGYMFSGVGDFMERGYITRSRDLGQFEYFFLYFIQKTKQNTLQLLVVSDCEPIAGRLPLACPAFRHFTSLSSPNVTLQSQGLPLTRWPVDIELSKSRMWTPVQCYWGPYYCIYHQPTQLNGFDIRWNVSVAWLAKVHS